ncbi:MAG TPA: FkbM family methyltransferase [Bryobacteraceae bacterium]|nr:FkbM family methyltransferase [Bryobacteraceae bacterium]
MKKLAALLLLLVVGGLTIPLVWPKRADLLVQRIKGNIQIAEGCSVLTPGIFGDEERFERTGKEVREIQRDGKLALYDTAIGSLWYRADSWTLPALVQENEIDPYRFKEIVKPGDVVLDVGANVGTDAKSALAVGASLVVAIEPEPLTLECLRRNLEAEIRDSRVVVVPKGAWNREDTLLLHVDEANAGGSSFLWQKGGPSIAVPLATIDSMVAELQLPKVDVIKMDIEGSEKNALLGAAETIRRHHPRLAIALEHNVNDVTALPAVARELWPDYQLELTPCTKTLGLVHPRTALLTP